MSAKHSLAHESLIISTASNFENTSPADGPLSFEKTGYSQIGSPVFETT